MLKYFHSNKGLTLIEIMAVVVILGIVATIAVPLIIGLIENAEEEVCDINKTKLKSYYESYLLIESALHSDIIFAKYLLEFDKDLCPESGEYNYVEGNVECSVHSIEDREIEDRDEDDEGVPFL